MSYHGSSVIHKWIFKTHYNLYDSVGNFIRQDHVWAEK